MQGYEVGLQRRIFALALAAAGILQASLVHTVSSALMMCAGLLFAWDLAFTPSLPLRSSLEDVYEMGLHGWRAPVAHKVVTLLATALFGAGIFFQVSG